MSTRDPRAAFQCNSGYFGSMLAPSTRTLRYDDDNGYWILSEDGKPFLRSKYKEHLERWMDWLENRERLQTFCRDGMGRGRSMDGR